MKRENGFYWVKRVFNSSWESAEWRTDEFHTTDGFIFYPTQLEVIDEERILNPDEKKEEEFHNKADNDRPDCFPYNLYD